ncbi:MAG: hypothetical protein JWQ35_462 [Bacteriovoracaceae bacterium]|nr:hypothetical protein [Bacteriovoracaceae bacterium]
MKKTTSLIIYSTAIIANFVLTSSLPVLSQSPTGSPSPGPARDNRQSLQDRIERERRDALQKAGQPVAEAFSALEETRMAINALDQKDNQQATQALERAIGKLEIVLSKYPNLALVPIVVETNVFDLIADDKTIKSVTDQVHSLINNQEYQAARRLLRNFVSEITVSSMSLPMATYPDAIRQAAKLIGQNKTQDAKILLLVALHSIVVTEAAIPLPIIRAEALIDESNQMLNQRNPDRKKVSSLVDEASHQLTLTEEFGYAKKQDLADLRSELKQLRENIDRNKDDKGLIVKIRQSLEALRKKIK